MNDAREDDMVRGCADDRMAAEAARNEAEQFRRRAEAVVDAVGATADRMYASIEQMKVVEEMRRTPRGVAQSAC